MRSIIFLSSLVLVFTAGSTTLLAQGRGISVSQKSIDVSSVEEWPYITEFFITNQSENDEWVEITTTGDVFSLTTITPSRFALLGNTSVRVLLTIDQPKGSVIGTIRVQASRSSHKGLATGVGIEIPVTVSAKNNINLQAAVANFSNLSLNKSTMFLIVLLAIVLLVGWVFLFARKLRQS